MNIIECKMVDALKEMRDSYAVVGVKAEFEAEGTRTEELMRLKEICMAAKVGLTLKIGGCEAVRDMYDARAVGVRYLVAPMVETAFALRKYLRAIDVAFTPDEQEKIDFLINVETIQSVQNFGHMLNLPEIGRLGGIVVGRVDLTGSMNLDRKAAETEKVFEITRNLLRGAREHRLTTVVGGAISVDALPFLRRLNEERLIDRYETRKVCFSCPEALTDQAATGITRAVAFELLWLQNKRSYYRAISEEDDRRIEMLEARFKRPA